MQELLSVQVERRKNLLKSRQQKSKLKTDERAVIFHACCKYDISTFYSFEKHQMFFCDKHYLQRFSAEPNKKKWKEKGEKRESEKKVCFFLFSVAATVTWGSLLNTGNCLVCFSVSDCHTTLFVVPFWTIAYRIKACMKVCRLVKTRDVLNHIPYTCAHTHTHSQSSVTKDSSTLMMKQCACACKWKGPIDAEEISYFWTPEKMA